MIIGVTGKMGAGKTTFVEYLAAKGFKKISLSDFIKEEAARRGVEMLRKNLQDIGNEMRQAHGVGYWAKLALEKMAGKDDYVVDSIRNPGEVTVLAQAGNFKLVSIEAPLETRFLRLNQAKRLGKFKTVEDFKESEARELMSTAKYNQQLEKCARMADFRIDNDSDKELFFKKIDAFLRFAGRQKHLK
jgi:dephospho-CoA kinase